MTHLSSRSDVEWNLLNPLPPSTSVTRGDDRKDDIPENGRQKRG